MIMTEQQTYKYKGGGNTKVSENENHRQGKTYRLLRLGEAFKWSRKS